MKLLIVTQVVDTKDSNLGFFIRWIEEFAKQVEHVEVICLKKGEHSFPENVRMHSLGKERGKRPSFVYAIQFIFLIWKLRKEYDSVFVHMNPEYVVLGGFFWRLWGKRIALWYTHKSINLKLRIATFFAHTIFTASKESFRLKSSKIHIMGHGIDTDFFNPDPNTARGRWALSVGRLMGSKRHDLVVESVARAGCALRIIGEGPERGNLESLAQKLSAQVHFLGGLTQTQLRDEYRKAKYLVHTSETGSLDKVVLEALATDVAVITTSNVFMEFPVKLVAATPEAIAEAFKESPQGYNRVQIIRDRHSLQKLIPAMLQMI